MNETTSHSFAEQSIKNQNLQSRVVITPPWLRCISERDYGRVEETLNNAASVRQYDITVSPREPLAKGRKDKKASKWMREEENWSGHSSNLDFIRIRWVQKGPYTHKTHVTSQKTKAVIQAWPVQFNLLEALGTKWNTARRINRHGVHWGTNFSNKLLVLIQASNHFHQNLQVQHSAT